ncbi:hypothetical protein CEXT_80571 [Caerostris extrusa]|uniref:Uncharacterized protein n=1 Tax=Caerostris extrusa TaxID=172846 RepID=A0AAV4TGH5_CAEEX|nr:hypothetical protein CEXT_80571 [Caerostris extrusa]
MNEWSSRLRYEGANVPMAPMGFSKEIQEGEDMGCRILANPFLFTLGNEMNKRVLGDRRANKISPLSISKSGEHPFSGRVYSPKAIDLRPQIQLNGWPPLSLRRKSNRFSVGRCQDGFSV